MTTDFGCSVARFDHLYVKSHQKGSCVCLCFNQPSVTRGTPRKKIKTNGYDRVGQEGCDYEASELFILFKNLAG